MREEDSLAKAAGRGDTEAFGALYETYFQRIYRYVYHRVFSREAAEDLCSQAFLKALEGIGGYKPARGTFSSWLFRIAGNCVTDYFRSLRFSSPSGDLWDVPDDVDFVVDTENRLHWEKLKPLLAGLAPDSRDLVVMRIWDGLSFSEIAGITGRTESACKMSFSRSISSLKVAFGISLFLVIFTPQLCGTGRTR